tara:strand:- start:233 stop:538 length:306 start_codon:yes stop_codon:yes gene_type:complete
MYNGSLRKLSKERMRIENIPGYNKTEEYDDEAQIRIRARNEKIIQNRNTKLMKQNADNKRKLDDNCSRNSENLRKTARGKKLRKKRKSHKIKAISRYGKKN